MTIWSAASSVTSCPALLSSSGSSKTQHANQQRRSSKRIVPRTKVRDLVDSSTDEFSSRENLTKTPTLRPPKKYVPRYITNNASPLTITSRNTLNSNGVSSNSNISTISKGSSFVTAVESDCLSRRLPGNCPRIGDKKCKDKVKAEGDMKQFPLQAPPAPPPPPQPPPQQLFQLPGCNMLKRTASIGSNLSKSTGGLLILPRMSIESMTTNEMLHLAEEQTAISDKSPWHNPQTVLDGIASESPRRMARTKSLQTIKSLQAKNHQERKIQFGKNILQFRPPSRIDVNKTLPMSLGKNACIHRKPSVNTSQPSTSTLGLCASNLNNSSPVARSGQANNLKQAESVILTVLQILYFYGTFFLGFGLLLVAYYLHD